MSAKSVSTVLPHHSDKNKVVRFQDRDSKVMTSAYVSNEALKKIGNPKTIKVTIEAVEEE